MKKRNLILLIATAIITLAGCTNDEFVGQVPNTNPLPEEEPVPICFGSHFKAATRADIIGADAAKLLNSRFIVSGYKGKQSAYVTTEGDNQSVLVFDNYQVTWAENSAKTTDSNVADWEYATKEKYFRSSASEQTVKYWDNSFPQYDFIAYSLGTTDPATATSDWEGDMPKAGKIGVSAIDPSALKTAAYTLSGSAADLSGCYIADLVTVSRGKEGYAEEPVTIKFRHLSSKIRLAIYETVPGYNVKEVKFYADADATTPTTTAALYGSTSLFRTSGTYTVFYPTLDTPENKDNNMAHIKYSGKAQASGQFGAFPQTVIGQTSSGATYAGNAANQYFTAILPQAEEGILNLRIDFTLEATDGMQETIRVYGATAQVPATYTKWQPGYAYTYIFKITKDTNGYTDPEHIYPEGLYPITFDAMVIDDMTSESVYEFEVTNPSE